MNENQSLESSRKKEDDEDSVFSTDFIFPDRNSSASAPPALEIATESVFAFTVEYAKIFSDIRAHEDYYNFYENSADRDKLPPPLQSTPFPFEPFDDERFVERYSNSNDQIDSKEQEIYEASQQLQKMQIGRQIPHSQPERIPRSGVWNPLARKSLEGIPLGHSPSFSRLQQEHILNGSWSSPNAQTPFNTAQYIWRDEENPPNFQNQYMEPSLNNGGIDILPQMKMPEMTPPTMIPSMFPHSNPQETTTQQNGNYQSEEEEEDRPTQICRYFAAGFCSRGDKCFYSHDIESQDKNKNGKTPDSKKSKAKGYNKTKATTPPRLPEQFYQNFDQLIGKIYLVSKDQQGCRFLQKKLEEKDPVALETIFTEVYDHITELMTDPFGNYLCQKLLEHCNDDQRLAIIQKVGSDLVEIAKNMHGTRAVQKLIECLSLPKQIEIVRNALKNSVVVLIQDLNGNHVIQRCLNRLEPNDKQFIYDAVTTGNHCVQVATHRHGCCVLQRCIDHASKPQKVQLVNEIIRNALPLVQDPYGNYVVQYVLELPFPDLVDRLAASFLGHLKGLSTQKFSSNVIEKCLQVGGDKVKESIIKELLGEDSFLDLLQDPFANYVIQTAITVATPKLHQKLVDTIRPHSTTLRTTPYGKRILSHLNKTK